MATMGILRARCSLLHPYRITADDCIPFIGRSEHNLNYLRSKCSLEAKPASLETKQMLETQVVELAVKPGHEPWHTPDLR